MEDWQVKLQIQAMAIMVEVEGMKAENVSRIDNGHSIAYDDFAFSEKSQELMVIAAQICNR